MKSDTEQIPFGYEWEDYPRDVWWWPLFVAEIVLMLLGAWKLIELAISAWRHFAAVFVLAVLFCSGCRQYPDTTRRPIWVRAIESGDYSGWDHVGDFMLRDGRWVPVRGAPPPRPVNIKPVGQKATRWL